MINTREIPAKEWPQFFKTFNASHGGWTCTIEILGDSLGAQLQSSGMPLTGIDADASAETHITVALGEKPEAHLSHVIDAPEHVWLMQADTGDEVLEIVSGELRTLLRFQSQEAKQSAPTR